MAEFDEHLRRVLDSRTFAHAPRLRRLLRSLANGLTPPEDFQADRDRLASRLAAYYASEGETGTLQFRLTDSGLRGETKDGAPPVPAALAVLPVIGQTPEYSFLADGLTDDLITTLSCLPELRVVGRNSVFLYRDQRRDIRQIAAQLSVTYVLESILQVVEGRLQMALQLVDAHNGWMLWEERFDRPLGELLGVRNEVLAALTDALRIESPHSHLYTAGTSNVNAYFDCLRGRQALAQRTPESLKVCLLYFRSAAEQHAEYGSPHAFMAECYLIQTVNDLASARDVIPLAEAEARAAISIDPGDAHARAVLGAIYAVYEWNWVESAAELENAIRSRPGAAQYYQLDAMARLVPQGRWEEAFEAMDRARKLDPAAAALTRDLGLMHFLRRDYDGALTELRKVRDLPGAEYWLGRLFIELRRFKEALDVLEPAGEASHRALSGVAYCFARMGRKSQADQVMRQLRETSRKSRVTALDFAHPLIGLGRYDEAFAYLRQAVSEHTSNLIYFQVDPVYDPLHKDPRSLAIRKELGLAKP